MISKYFLVSLMLSSMIWGFAFASLPTKTSLNHGQPNVLNDQKEAERVVLKKIRDALAQIDEETTERDSMFKRRGESGSRLIKNFLKTLNADTSSGSRHIFIGK